MNKTLFMETTKISTDQTVSQIQRILGLYGASAILIEYDKQEVSSISFKVKIENAEVPFRLPCRWKSIYDLIQRKRARIRSYEVIEEQAKRVAWRQILRWVEAQMAMVETGMVKVQEVFLPYMQVGINETFFERIQAGKFKALTEGKQDEI
jgi:hypothetical protein